MEGLVEAEERLPDPAFWRGRRVLLTGHTGFKGGWAALWLAQMGAEVTGLALAPESEPSLYALAAVERDLDSRIADLRDRDAVAQAVGQARPHIVLHMAAQALVRRSLADPAATFETNVMGTVHLLEALTRSPALEAVLIVTSDKVYANVEAGAAFREADALGGKDPYSASKAATELVAAAYAASRFRPGGIRLATARAGNVIGGGDFGAERLVPDIVRAVQQGSPLILRHPEAVRPWQHVVDCVAGYLVYAEALAAGEEVPASLNFGPAGGDPITVAALAEAVQGALGIAPGWRHEPVAGSVEARTLTLDATLARQALAWRDRLPGILAVKATAEWYAAWLSGADMRRETLAQITRHMMRAGAPPVGNSFTSAG